MTRCNCLQLPKAASWAPITTDPTQICSISTHLSESPTTSAHLCVPFVHKAQDFTVKIVTSRRQYTRYETPRPNHDFISGFTDFLLLSCPSVWLYKDSWEALASYNVLLANSLVLGSRFCLEYHGLIFGVRGYKIGEGTRFLFVFASLDACRIWGIRR